MSVDGAWSAEPGTNGRRKAATTVRRGKVSSRLDGHRLESNTVGFHGQSRLSGFHRAFTQFVGSLPLMGRHNIRALVYQCRDARGVKERREAWKKLLGAAGFYIPTHAAQSGLGFWVAGKYAAQFAQHPTLINGVATALGVVFGVTNALVAATQADVSLRLGSGLWKRRNNPPESEPPPKARPARDLRRLKLDLAITLTGHAAFAVALVPAVLNK